MSQVTEQSVRFQTALASIKLIQASAVLDLTEDDFDFLTSNKVWIATDRSRARRCVEACVYGTLDFVGYPRFPAPVEFIAAVIAYYVHPVNIQTACLIMEGAEFTENIINEIGRAVQQECRDRARMPSSARKKRLHMNARAVEMSDPLAVVDVHIPVFLIRLQPISTLFPYTTLFRSTLDFVGYPRFPAPVEFIAAVIAYYVHPVNIQTACLIMEGAEFTENIINGVERPVKAAELFAFTLRVRAGNTDVLTDAEENVRQKLRAEGVM